MTDREILLKKISTYEFAVLDLQIFLDTHPGDAAVLEKISGYKEKLAPLVSEFEKKYGPLTKSAASEQGANTWSWVKDPWPWQNEEDE